MFSKKLVGSFGAGVAALGIAVAAAPAQAATFTVNNADSGGAGSLRAAITAAEATNRPDEIVFEIPGQGVHTIVLANDLPGISKPLTIRGYSQPGAAPATGNAPARPKIVIDAAAVGRGIDIGGDDNEIRGLVVKNAGADGIRVEGDDNVVAGNHIGTNAAGGASRPNGGPGVSVVGRNNVIGGPEPKDRNVIASNSGGQVVVTDGTGHLVEGNRIGTNAAGTERFFGPSGITLESSGNTVRDNLISGQVMGVVIEGDENTLHGNSIGTKRSGKRALHNVYGILIDGGDDNRIGGTGEGEGNLVSGNDFAGIRIVSSDEGAATGNVLEGNLIGTTLTGRAPLPNGAQSGAPGVSLFGAADTIVGGTVPGAGNVIAANGGSGVSIDGGDDNLVGSDDEAAPRNTIMHNGDDGVTVRSGDGNAILGNRMASNDDLGIDLGADSSTANDSADLDAGANGLQNGPEIDAVTRTTVEWALETRPQSDYRLEFFVCDGRGAGEGETFLGSTSVTTDANGDADDTTTLPARVRGGDHVAMTATRTVGGASNTPRDTSELSPCEEVE